MSVREINVVTGEEILRDYTKEEVLATAVAQDALVLSARSDMRLSFAQLLIGLVTEGWIAEAEGDAWLTGTLPSPVVGLISTLPVEQQFPAKARALRPSEVNRSDALVVALGTAQGKTAEELDTFFRTYAQV